MNNLYIETQFPEAVKRLLLQEQLIEDYCFLQDKTPNPMRIKYPDDSLSQSLVYWFAMAEGCGLVDLYVWKGVR